MKLKNALLIILLVLFAGSLFLNFHFKHRLDNIPRESYIDTITYSVPVPRDSVVIRYETHTLPVAPKPVPPDTVFRDRTDTLYIHDSVKVLVPITQKYYHEKEYEAWVSGFNPALDSINVYAPTTVINDTHWLEVTVGLQTGVGWNGQGWSPYLGAGVQVGIPLRKIFNKSKPKK